MTNNAQKKVIVGISGGVDSSVSAWLLQQQNYRVEGLFMKNWEEDDNEEYCAAANDLADAKEVCKTLGVTLHTVNFANEYWKNVFIHFLDEYKAGRTPNPDILCNKEIKFKSFLEFAHKELNADLIATGHYVRSRKIKNKIQLLRGLDHNKDQSYFLYTLENFQLSNCLFPVGTLSKSEVRRIASSLGLVTANKRDSTGICFIGKRKLRDFLSRYLLTKPGSIISIKEEEVGHHEGLAYYTLGQRRGLRIGGIRNGKQDPWYVVDKDIVNNRLIVTQGHEHPSLMSIGFTVSQPYWVDREPLKDILSCSVKTRYRQPDVPCLIEPITEESLKVTVSEPVFAVTPGQSAVFYLKERCLGGGVIETRQPLNY